MNEQLNIRQTDDQHVKALKDHDTNSQRRLQWSGTSHFGLKEETSYLIQLTLNVKTGISIQCAR